LGTTATNQNCIHEENKCRILSSGMWHGVHRVWTDVSEECIASIFRVEKSGSEELKWAATFSLYFLARGPFYPEDGGDTFLRNVGSRKIYTAPHPRKQHSS
jgi:hypothetical protein